MEVILDCAKLTGPADSHKYLKELFGFPDWYGNNLDALYDCLTTISHCRVILQNPAALCDEGNYGGAVLAVMTDAADENPDFRLTAGNINI